MAAIAPEVFLRLVMKMTLLDENGSQQGEPIDLDEQLTGEAPYVEKRKVTENGGSVTFNLSAIGDPQCVFAISDKPVTWDPNAKITVVTDRAKGHYFFAVDKDGGDCQIDSLRVSNQAAADSNNNDAFVTVYCFGSIG